MFWWEKAKWPAKKGDEVSYRLFEDIRKLTFLLENPAAGNFDIYRFFGKHIGGGVYAPYDEQNWAGSWAGYEPPNLAKPGEIIIVYKDHTGTEDIYVNWIAMSASELEKYPPIQSDNTLDKRFWRLTTNPNYYCHYNHNAGKPKIGADGRYYVIYHAASVTYGYLSYVCKLIAHKWLPRHTHPERQVAPVKYKSGKVKQRRDPHLYGVEKKHKYITQNLGTQWPRDYASKYRKLTEYVMLAGEPDAAVANQYGYDPKMCEAYQDRAIRTMEHEPRYLAKVDQTYIDAWTRRQGSEWTGNTIPDTWYFSGTEQWVQAADIVYPPGGGADGTRYLCIKTHISTAATAPPNPTYWTTPAYRPDLCIYQPVYDALGARFFCCNGSAFEKALKEIEHYDWWWDASFPFIPEWLGESGGHHETDPITWPLPCGCWRRTWRHSMGRVGAIMWLGESGEPPEYYPDHMCVTQAVYDAANNPANYKVVNNPPDFTLTEEQEKALKRRHDARAVSTVKRNSVTSIEPHYEIHQDLVNDVYDALKELKLIDWTHGSRCWKKSGLNTNSSETRDSSLTAYAAGRLSAIAAKAWPWPNPNSWEGGMEETFGYSADVRGYGPPPEYRPFGVDIRDEFALCLRVPKTGMLPGMLSGRLLLRVRWKGVANPNDIQRFTECEFGFEDKTLVGVPGDTEWNYAWVALRAGAVIESDADNNYYWFYGYVVSEWPYTEKGGWMDFVFPDSNIRIAISQIVVGVPDSTIGNLPGRPMRRSIFEIDWDKVPESVFTELETNAIELKK